MRLAAPTKIRGSKAKLRGFGAGNPEGWQGELGLLRAMLDRALRDLRVLDAKENCPGKKHDYDDAWEWMFAYRYEEFGFEWVLDHLGFLWAADKLRDVAMSIGDINTGDYRDDDFIVIRIFQQLELLAA